MSASAATRAGSGAERSGAPAHLSITCSRCGDYLRRVRGDLLSSLRPGPGPLIAERVAARQMPGYHGPGGTVPEFQRRKPAGTANGTAKRLISRDNRARFQSSSEKPSRMRRARVGRCARITADFGGTLEPRNSINILYVYEWVSGSKAVPAGRDGWNPAGTGCAPVRSSAGGECGRDLIGGGYRAAGARPADQHLERRDGGEKFWGSKRLGAAIEGGGVELGAGRGNGGKPPFSRSGDGYVGMDASEWTVQGIVTPRFSGRCRQIGNLRGGGAAEAGGCRSAGGGCPPPSDARGSPCTLAREIFGHLGRFGIVRFFTFGIAAPNFRSKMGSGVRALPRLALARDRMAPRQRAEGVGDRISSGSLRGSSGTDAMLGMGGACVKG